MKKILFACACALTLITQATIYWNQDRPFVGLPPMPQQIYRCPLNEIRRCTYDKSCSPDSIQDTVHRKDILKFIREEKARCKHNRPEQKEA